MGVLISCLVRNKNKRSHPMPQPLKIWVDSPPIPKQYQKKYTPSNFIHRRASRKIRMASGSRIPYTR